jgi:hypothetical protein
VWLVGNGSGTSPPIRPVSPFRRGTESPRDSRENKLERVAVGSAGDALSGAFECHGIAWLSIQQSCFARR